MWNSRYLKIWYEVNNRNLQILIESSSKCHVQILRRSAHRSMPRRGFAIEAGAFSTINCSIANPCLQVRWRWPDRRHVVSSPSFFLDLIGNDSSLVPCNLLIHLRREATTHGRGSRSTARDQPRYQYHWKRVNQSSKLQPQITNTHDDTTN